MPQTKSLGISRLRGNLPAISSGLGVHFTSPVKGHRASKRKTQKYASNALGFHAKKQRLEAELASLMGSSKAQLEDPPAPDVLERLVGACSSDLTAEGAENMDGMADFDPDPDHALVDSNLPTQPAGLDGLPAEPKTKRLKPDLAAVNLYDKWQKLLPSLLPDLLAYYAASTGQKVQSIGHEVNELCPSQTCRDTKSSKVLVLYFDHFTSINVTHCLCRKTSQVLVKAGLFPTAPSQIRMALSVDLLNFYSALFERSCDAVNAMSAALNTFYSRRGYHLLNKKDEKFREPFRRGLGYAMQWLDMLHVLIEQSVETALNQADAAVQNLTKPTLKPMPPPPSPDFDYKNLPPHSNSLDECSRVLRQLCPACFGSTTFGRPFDEGGDFHVCTDGNFHHRHLASGGQGIPFHAPRHIIPKSFVDEVGERIDQARKRKPKPRDPKVPDEAVDECQGSYEAADGDKKKAAGSRYDAQGWMSLICRHDVPLFFANIDTPGEQQKFAVALIIWFFHHIPSNATVKVLYDIGCVLDRSAELYDIFPMTLLPRVQFATTAMHAYGHQWACQLAFNPRLLCGMGLSDGEGVERVWGLIRKLISLVRTSSAARRIWMTDRQLTFIAAEIKDGLGDWIRHRLDRGVKAQGDKAQATLDDCGFSVAQLRRQWELQKEAQISVRAHAPVRLRKEIDTLLSLQTELEDVKNAIKTTQSALTSAPKKATKILKNLLEAQDELIDDLDELYGSLDIQESFPDLEGVDFEFVRVLLLARDQKIVIRKRAIGSFFEWDRLDQAVGGRNQALGTKLHQQTRKAISKRQPSLVAAIKRYNRYCARLEELYDPSYKIPLPAALPTKLADLRQDSNLMEDVWIEPSEMETPLWLEDQGVRTGIRAMLKKDRCIEEQRRLGREADNLCRWFGRELAAVEVALRTKKNTHLITQLTRHRDHLLHLKARWSNPPSSIIRFDAHVKEASEIADSLTGCYATSWVNTTIDVEETFLSPLDLVFVDDDDDRHPLPSTFDSILESSDRHPMDAEDAECDGSPDLGDVLLSDSFLEENGAEEDIDVQDTSTFAYDDGLIQFPCDSLGISKDEGLIFDLNRLSIPPPQGHPYSDRIIGPFVFDQTDIERLEKPTALLNDICINGLAHYLQAKLNTDPKHRLSSNECAIFSTHDLVRIRYKASDPDLWRSVAQTEYWKKSVWIVPIHRPQDSHWVLAVVYPLDRHIQVYDSLASKRRWPQDLKDLSILTQRLTALASTYGQTLSSGRAPQPWIASPMVKMPVQSNGHDCGLWVLLWVMVLLRGYDIHGSNVDEIHMAPWRSMLASFVRSLPAPHAKKRA